MSERKIISSSLNLHGKKLKLEAGKFAPQADVSVYAQLGETSVLATVVSKKASKEDSPAYFPLRIDYEEKLYAGGVIKGGRWRKREGRPSDESIVQARLIDHAVRPLFPDDLMDEVQLVITALSVDDKHSLELVSMIAASAALTASPVPFNGPMATVQIGMDKEGEFLINPTIDELEESRMELMATYLEGERLQAVEGEAHEISDEKVLEAYKLGYDKAKPLFDFINDFSEKVGLEKRDYVSFKPSEEVFEEVKKEFAEDVKELVGGKPKGKVEYWDTFDELKEKAKDYFSEKYEDEVNLDDVSNALEKLQKKYIRENILQDGARIDGRDLDEIRPLSSEAEVLPKVHGSALFNRGLTQVLSITTLGSPLNTLHHEDVYGQFETRFFHHYVAPGFAFGEPRPMRGPGRREIGHGMLVQKALSPVLPEAEDFPYVIRVVSEAVSQNGSSSMASVCGSTMSLMDSGVPIKNKVGGVSIGLVLDEETGESKIVTDIQGAEDFAGYMDYKMAGTKDGVTAIQMDIKLAGIPLDLFEEIIEKSKAARMRVIEHMDETITNSRESVKESAPKVEKIKVEKDNVGLLIGPGGSTIKSLQDKSGASIEVIENDEDVATALVMSEDVKKVKKAVELINDMFREPEIGEEFEGEVVKILDFGALVEFLPNRKGLVHISELADGYVENVSDHVSEGDKVKVKLKEVDSEGRYNLTMKL